MKILSLLLLFTTLIFANEYKKIAVIPANVAYNSESVQEFSEILYDSVVNAVAEYNFAQKLPSNMYKLKGPLLPQKSFAQKIRNTHILAKRSPNELLEKHHLDKLIVMDFNSRNIMRVVQRCKHLCNVKISFLELTRGKPPVSKTVTYKFDAASCLLSDSSTYELNRSITDYLNK